MDFISVLFIEFHFPIESPWHLHQKSHDHMWVGVFLGSLLLY